jgi:rhodanese-related sulfurtransferase
VQYLTPTQLSEWMKDAKRAKPVLLDVREPWEFDLCRLEPSLHFPMSSIPVRLDELDPSKDMVVICHHGARSYQVASFLEQRGFNRLYNLEGGIDEWARTVDPSMPTY